jgi:hypothetical protein
MKARRPDLTEKVIWASDDIGDGLGYDIEAVDEQGRPLFIEVKATNQGPEASFFIRRQSWRCPSKRAKITSSTGCSTLPRLHGFMSRGRSSSGEVAR